MPQRLRIFSISTSPTRLPTIGGLARAAGPTLRARKLNHNLESSLANCIVQIIPSFLTTKNPITCRQRIERGQLPKACSEVIGKRVRAGHGISSVSPNPSYPRRWLARRQRWRCVVGACALRDRGRKVRLFRRLALARCQIGSLISKLDHHRPLTGHHTSGITQTGGPRRLIVAHEFVQRCIGTAPIFAHVRLSLIPRAARCFMLEQGKSLPMISR